MSEHGPAGVAAALYAQKLADVIEERDRLRQFVGRFIQEHAWGREPEPDGGDVQDAAQDLGIIVKVAHPQPCENEACNCEGSDYLFYLAWSEEAKVRVKEPTP